MHAHLCTDRHTLVSLCPCPFNANSKVETYDLCIVPVQQGSKPLEKRVTLGHVIASRVTKHHYVIIVSAV